MKKRLISAADVRSAKDRGELSLALVPGDLVTPLALDAARELGVQICYADGAAADVPAWSGAAQRARREAARRTAAKASESPAPPDPAGTAAPAERHPAATVEERVRQIVAELLAEGSNPAPAPAVPQPAGPAAAGSLPAARTTERNLQPLSPPPGSGGTGPIMTEAQLRDRIRQPQAGMSVRVPAGTRFSPAAQDFVKQWRLNVTWGEDPPATAAGASARLPADQRPAWDRAVEFPVKLEGALPTCSTCGMPVKPKPEHLTQLNADHFVPKNTPRIRLRGKLDTLHALVLLVGSQARAAQKPDLAADLETLAAYCREIVSAEYNERAAAPLALAGVDEETLHKATHHPETAFGIPHILPDTNDAPLLLWLNYLRCAAREAEIAALDAFTDAENKVTQPSLVKAVNRLSSAVYYLELLLKAGS